MISKIKKFISLGGLSDTVGRFPLSVFCSFICFMIGLVAVIEPSLLSYVDKFLTHTIILSIIGFFWFGCVQIVSEAKSIAFVPKTIMGIVGLIVFGAIVFTSTEEFGLRLFTIISSLIILVTVAPYLFNKSSNLSYWMFNRVVWFGVAVSFLAALILWGGSAAALASVKYLFGIKVPSDVFMILWLFASTLLAPIYALSFIPKTFETNEDNCLIPEQVSFIASWIFAPLVIVYMAILYAYFVKIAITVEIPKGQLSYMIAGFAAAGVATFQFAWPLVDRKKGGRLLGFVFKYFFPALIIPVFVLFIAIYMRIAEYGVTEKRYIVFLSACWFLFLAVGFTLKKLQLKHIMISLALLLFFSSWGPWGMQSVSIMSQQGRLEALLVKNNLMVNGALVKTENQEMISFDDRYRISDIARYMHRTYKNETREKALFGEKSDYAFMQRIGVTQTSSYSRRTMNNQIAEESFSLRFEQKRGMNAYDVRDTDYFIQRVYLAKNNKAPTKFQIAKIDGRELHFRLINNLLSVFLDNVIVMEIDMAGIVQKELKDNPGRVRKKEPLVLKRENDRIRLGLEITDLSGEGVKSDLTVNRMTTSVFVTLK